MFTKLLNILVSLNNYKGSNNFNRININNNIFEPTKIYRYEPKIKPTIEPIIEHIIIESIDPILNTQIM